MSAVGVVDIITQIQTLIGASVPVSFGKKAKPINVEPPQIYVYPDGEDYEPCPGAGASSNPQILHLRIINLEVHCWGMDYGPAEQLAQCFITAMRVAMQGGSSMSYRLLRGQWVDTENMALGQELVLYVGFVCVVPRADLPFDGNDAAAATAVLTQFQPDTTGLSPGTGTPYWGETT